MRRGSATVGAHYTPITERFPMFKSKVFLSAMICAVLAICASASFAISPPGADSSVVVAQHVVDKAQTAYVVASVDAPKSASFRVTAFSVGSSAALRSSPLTAASMWVSALAKSAYVGLYPQPSTGPPRV